MHLTYVSHHACILDFLHINYMCAKTDKRTSHVDAALSLPEGVNVILYDQVCVQIVLMLLVSVVAKRRRPSDRSHPQNGIRMIVRLRRVQ